MTAELLGREAELEPWQPGAPARPSLRRAWSVRRSTYVRIVGVDVLRITTTISADVLAVLRERGIPRGPALANLPRRLVEVAVPHGTAAVWPALPHTRCVTTAVIRCPAPSVTSGSGLYPVDGRLWITPPTPAAPTTTDSDELAEAVAAALVRHARWTRLDTQHGQTREGLQP